MTTWFLFPIWTRLTQAWRLNASIQVNEEMKDKQAGGKMSGAPPATDAPPQTSAVPRTCLKLPYLPMLLPHTVLVFLNF